MANIKVDKNVQVFLVLGMIVMLVFAGFAAFKPVEVSMEPVDADAIAQAVIGAIVLPTPNASLTSNKLDEIYAEMFKEDTFEAEAEMLSMEELERKDYKELGEFLEEEFELEDEDDIDSVVIKDVTFSGMDIDDKDATVELELKVYYEDLDGESVKDYVIATIVIIDGEVDGISFEFD